MKLLQLEVAGGRGQRAQVGRCGGGGGGGGVCFGVFSVGWGGVCGGVPLPRRSVCFGLRASMREKGLSGAGEAQGTDSMTLKLLFWELEKHLKR